MTLTAVLFVGGESRRMGADKATLAWAGEPLWARQLRMLRELKPEALLVSARVKPAWCPADVEAVLDAPPSRGPLSGLAAALKNIRTTHLLALAIDLPLMTAEHLRKLRSLAKPGRGVIPAGNDGCEPLCAFYPAEAAGVAVDAISGHDRSLHHFARTLNRCDMVEFYYYADEEKALHHNANTPENIREIELHRQRQFLALQPFP